jgi:hypothetical protein
MKRFVSCKRGRAAARPTIYFIALFSFLFSLSSLSVATTYKTLTLEQMIAQCDLAFYGTVDTVEVIDRDGEPWTRVTFDVSNGLLGVEDDGSVTLTFYGGTLDNGVSLTVSLMPQFQEDEEVLILAYEDDLYSPIVGFRQGLWRNQGQGLQDEIGRTLSLVDGELALDGDTGGTEDILRTLKEALEDRGSQ